MKLLDVSLSPSLSWAQVEYFCSPYDQLYRVNEAWKIQTESYDCVYSKISDHFNLTCLPLVIKEWWYASRAGWHLVIDYIPQSTGIHPIDIEDELWIQWGGKYQLILHSTIVATSNNTESEISHAIDAATQSHALCEDSWFDNPDDESLKSKVWRLMLKKQELSMLPNDTMGRWTFWIVTNWNRAEWLRDLINSICIQGIPEFEILICGIWQFEWSDCPGSNMRFIPFNKRSNKGWLDKKKNLLIDSAKFENIALLHDRFVLDGWWYEWMQKWWNNFEVLSCHQTVCGFPDEIFPSSLHKMYYPKLSNLQNMDVRKDMINISSPLNVNEFEKFAWSSGGVVILKKSLGLKFDESLFWCQGEDLIFSKLASHAWRYIRYNPFSICRSQIYSWPSRWPSSIIISRTWVPIKSIVVTLIWLFIFIKNRVLKWIKKLVR